jgi:hypothetical protein
MNKRQVIRQVPLRKENINPPQKHQLFFEVLKNDQLNIKVFNSLNLISQLSSLYYMIINLI